jgi:hypothetical protein
LSKAVGPDFSVSKAADVTIVRFPQARRGPYDPPPPANDLNQSFDAVRNSTTADALNRVHQDFLTARAANSDFQAVVGENIRISYSAFGSPELSILHLI